RDGLNAVDQGQVDRADADRIHSVPGNAVRRLTRRVGQLLRHTVGRPHGASVEDLHAGAGAILIVGVLTIQGDRRDPEVVLHGQRHAGGGVVLQLGKRYVDVTVHVRMIQQVGWVEAAAPGHLHLVVAFPLPLVAGILILYLGREARQRREV